MQPPYVTAANLLPLEDDVMACQFPEPELVCSVQVAPESVEVQMQPKLVAANLLPSSDEVIEVHIIDGEEVATAQPSKLIEVIDRL